MPSFVALVVPDHRRPGLAEIAAGAERMLRVAWPGRAVLSCVEQGRTASALFLRVGGNPFVPDDVPVTIGDLSVVQAGYYLPAVGPADTPRASLAPTLASAGVHGLRHGDGVFSFAAWDRVDERFTAGVDKLGMRPLFWCELPGGGLAVASEIKTLLPLLGQLQVNWAAWEDQVRLGFQIGDHTLVRGVHRFRRAGCLTWRDGRLEHSVLENFLEDVTSRELSAEQFIEENHAAFTSAMARLLGMLGDTPPLLTISGGLDSRRLLAGLLCAGRPPELLTVAYPKPDGRDEETAIVERVARLAELPVSVLRLSGPKAVEWAAEARDAYADFETDEHGIYSLIAAAAGTRTAVNFDGLAGDTLLNPGQFLRPEYLAEGGGARFIADLSGGGDWIRLPAEGEPFRDRLREVWRTMHDAPNPITIFALDTRGRRELSLGPMLMQTRAFESVYPFLDREFMRSALALPPAERLRGLLQRRLTQRAWPPLADAPSTRDPGFDREPGVVRQVPNWRAQRPRSTVLAALRRGQSMARVPLGERAKLMLAAGFGERMGAERYRWQWGKANWIRRVRLQEQLVEAGWERYAENIARAIALPIGTAEIERCS